MVEAVGVAIAIAVVSCRRRRCGDGGGGAVLLLLSFFLSLCLDNLLRLFLPLGQQKALAGPHGRNPVVRSTTPQNNVPRNRGEGGKRTEKGHTPPQQATTI